METLLTFLKSFSLTVAIACAALHSQGPTTTGRAHRAHNVPVGSGAGFGGLIAVSGAGSQGNAQLRWHFSALTTSPINLDLGFPILGGIVQVAPLKFLISGRSSTFDPLTGYLCRVELNVVDEAITVWETQTYAGIDPFDIAWNANGSRVSPVGRRPRQPRYFRMRRTSRACSIRRHCPYWAAPTSGLRHILPATASSSAGTGSGRRFT